MAGWIDIHGPITADSVYVEGSLAARDVGITLPAVTPTTADYTAMGTLSLPVWSNLEAMQVTISQRGINQGLRAMLGGKAKEIEVRWLQEVLGSDGNSKKQGCKAFLRVVPMGIPGLGLEMGSPSDNDVVFAVLRYRLIIDGVEAWLIDRLNQKLVIGGVDYYSQVASFL
ncbi:MAG: phage major tail tube protein [Symbiobacteriaceae bacterium]|nr:phage major tail tube protein [Symbiobacteriaceae bacterium]